MRLEKLEALRGFAAFYVVLHHTIPHSATVYGLNAGILLRFGQEAVILFFLLSGFVINLSFQTSQNKTFKHYFSKRFLRIYIPLIVVFAVGYLLSAYNNGKPIDPEIPNLLKNLLMIQDWDKVKPNVLAAPYMSNIPLWSLSYEWWFYMLYFPLVSYIKNSRLRDTLVLAVCIISAVSYYYYPNFLNRLLMYLVIWWAGVQLSDLYLKSRLNTKAVTAPLLGVAVVMIILLVSLILHRNNGATMMLGMHPFLEFRHVTSALMMIVAGLLWRRIGWIGFNQIFKPFLWLAPISYVIYICHVHLMVDATYLDWIANKYLKWFAYMACLLMFSALVELWFYPRTRNWFLTLKKRQTPKPTA